MQKERRAPAWFSSPARAEGKGLNELDEAQYLPQSSIPSFPLMPLSMIRQVKTCVLVASQASLETQLASADFAPEEQDLVRYMETQLRALIEEQEKRHVERQVHLQLVASPGVVTKQALPSLMTKQVAKNMKPHRPLRRRAPVISRQYTDKPTFVVQSSGTRRTLKTKSNKVVPTTLDEQREARRKAALERLTKRRERMAKQRAEKRKQKQLKHVVNQFDDSSTSESDSNVDEEEALQDLRVVQDPEQDVDSPPVCLTKQIDLNLGQDPKTVVAEKVKPIDSLAPSLLPGEGESMVLTEQGMINHTKPIQDHPIERGMTPRNENQQENVTAMDSTRKKPQLEKGKPMNATPYVSEPEMLHHSNMGQDHSIQRGMAPSSENQQENKTAFIEQEMLHHSKKGQDHSIERGMTPRNENQEEKVAAMDSTRKKTQLEKGIPMDSRPSFTDQEKLHHSKKDHPIEIGTTPRNEYPTEKVTSTSMEKHPPLDTHCTTKPDLLVFPPLKPRLRTPEVLPEQNPESLCRLPLIPGRRSPESLNTKKKRILKKKSTHNRPEPTAINLSETKDQLNRVLMKKLKYIELKERDLRSEEQPPFSTTVAKFDHLEKTTISNNPLLNEFDTPEKPALSNHPLLQPPHSTTVAKFDRSEKPTLSNHPLPQDPPRVDAFDYFSIYDSFRSFICPNVGTPALRKKVKKGSLVTSEDAASRVQLKLVRNFMDIMSDFATVFSTTKGNNNNNNEEAEDTHSSQLYFRVNAGTRPEVSQILYDTFAKLSQWQELPSGLGLQTTWNFLWTWGKPRIDRSSLLSWQIVNHFPSVKALTRKDMLKTHLTRIQKYNRTLARAFDILPPTFILPQDYMAFVSAFTQRLQRVGAVANVWILKPVCSSRGRGIRLLNDLDEVRYGEPVILQEYLDDPLLLNGYKFDLRLYVLLTSVQPLEAFVYQEGFVRLCTAKYSMNTLEDLTVHLTNSSIQQKCLENLTKDNPVLHATPGQAGGSKTSLVYLWTRLAQDPDAPPVSSIQENINQIILKALVCTEEHISPCANSCEVLGFDVLLDATYRPWLIEVNCSPSLSRESGIDVIKNQMIFDTIELVKPLAYDRAALRKILERRLDETSAQRKRPYQFSHPASDQTTTSKQQQLNRDLKAILKGQIPRQYGDLPQNMGNYKRLCPQTSMYDDLMKLKHQFINRR